MRLTIAVLFGSWIVVLAGCFRSPLVHFYSLMPVPTLTEHETKMVGPRVEVVVTSFPGYLDNPQMALRRDDGEIVLDEFNRWVEELRRNFERTVMENLVARLDNAAVVVVQPYEASTAARSVRIEVIQFDISESGEAILKARWGVYDGKESSPPALTLSVFRHAADLTSAQARVDALSRTVAAMSDQLAQEIRRDSRGRE
jgi:uncharacterized lipoprotein YmbA